MCGVLCCVVLWCVEVYGVLWCVMWCVCSVPSVRAGGVLFKTRTQYQGVLGNKFINKNDNNIENKHNNTIYIYIY